MKNYILLGLIAFSTIALQGSESGFTEAEKKASEEQFIKAVVEFLQPKEGDIAPQVEQLKKVFSSVPKEMVLDVDTMTIGWKLLSSEKSMNFGEFLSEAASYEEDLLLKVPHSKVRAKIVLALVYNSRSKKELINNPVRILRFLIKIAANPESSTDLVFKRKDLDLVQYVSAGRATDAYDLSQILWDEEEGISIDTYLQEQAKKHKEWERVYKLLKPYCSGKALPQDPSATNTSAATNSSTSVPDTPTLPGKGPDAGSTVKGSSTTNNSSTSDSATPTLPGNDVASGSPVKGSSATPSPLSSSDAFINVIGDTLKANEMEFDACFDEVKRIFRERGPFDIDQLPCSPEAEQLLGCKSFGDYLNKVAFGECIIPKDPIVGCSNAQIILAFLCDARSKRNTKADSTGLLFTLVHNAQGHEKFPLDDATQGMFFLQRYVNAGDFNGPYDLSKIKIVHPKEESFQDYFERASKKSATDARIYKLIKSCSGATRGNSSNATPTTHVAGGNSSPAQTPADTTPTIPTAGLGVNGLQGVQDPAAQTGNNHQQDNSNTDDSSTTTLKGWRSYLTPRTFLVVGGLCCVGALIYKNYRSRAKDETDRKVVAVR